MKLSREEQAMLDGELGEPRRWAMEHMIQVTNWIPRSSRGMTKLRYLKLSFRDVGPPRKRG